MSNSNLHVLRLACKPIPTIRIGFIGMGSRGQKTLYRYLDLPHIDIVAVCDLAKENALSAKELLVKQGRFTPYACHGEEAWKEVCEDANIDLIFICTDWVTHADIACYAMQCNKHVALEVPAAMTITDCWRLVNTAEITQRHCMMVENCCYDPYNLMALNLTQKGYLGEISHAEGAYIHDLRHEYARNAWMKKYNIKHKGNFYPTHGLGPICQQMNIHRGDCLDYLISMSSDIRQHDMPSINSTLIKTKKGRSILLQYNVDTPRPYSRIQITCGTQGFIQKYPIPTLMLDGWEKPLVGEALTEEFPKYAHELSLTLGKEAYDKGIDNEMNYIMDKRLIHCLRNGLPLDQDVYDAAEWSCITELSEISVQKGGTPVSIPDFTRGRWQLLKKHEIV